MSCEKRVCAIVLAAGVGERMQSETTKQRINILGRPVLYYALAAFEACDDIDDIVVVTRSDEIGFVTDTARGMEKVRSVITGGACRAESAMLGFAAIPDGTAFVAIHDAARALITPENISAVVAGAMVSGAASAVSLVTDTIKVVDNNGVIVSTVDRATLRRAETPQIFSVELYRRAIKNADMSAHITDDNMLLEHIGVAVSAVDVGRENVKITMPDDLRYAEFLLRGRGWQDV